MRRKDMRKNKKEVPDFTFENVIEAAQRSSSIEEYLFRIIHGRQTEVRAILYALGTGNNIMLDGSHGLGKSYLADQLFKCLDPSLRTFKLQLNRSTDPETVVGAFNLLRYREKAVMEYNTESFLPTAHVAFLDEVYRASEKFLPIMMGILNEHEFKNGTTVQKCPLISTIGTTNFVTDSQDLDAFNDRWLINVNVLPIPENERVDMITAAETKGDLTKVEPLRLKDLQAMQYAMDNITFSESFKKLYVRFVKEVQTRMMPGKYISDRRLIKTLSIIKLSYISELLIDEEIDPYSITFDSELLNVSAESKWALSALASAQYGLMQVGDPVQQNKFETVAQDFINQATATI